MLLSTTTKIDVMIQLITHENSETTITTKPERERERERERVGVLRPVNQYGYIRAIERERGHNKVLMCHQ